MRIYLFTEEEIPQKRFHQRKAAVSMKKMKIKLGSIADVKEFVALTNSCSFESDLVSGRYAVDAKSIMGIFSLDLAKPLEFIVHDDSAKADELLDAVLKFKA